MQDSGCNFSSGILYHAFCIYINLPHLPRHLKPCNKNIGPCQQKVADPFLEFLHHRALRPVRKMNAV